jgi:NADH dehydrogenase
VGSFVVPALLAAGHNVVGLARTTASAEPLRLALPLDARSRLEVRIGDVTQPETLGAALAGVDAVHHLVAIPRDFTGGRDLHRVNTAGTGAMVEAALAAGVRRFVHQGALGVTEDPNLHYADSKAKGERIVRESGLDWTVLRPSLLWGEGDGFFGLIAKLARISPGVIPVPGRGTARFQPLWAGDLARCVVLSLERPDTIGQAYDLGGPAYWTYREITREVLHALGKQRVIMPMPVPLISLVSRLSELVHVPFPVASDQLRQLKFDNIGPIDGVARAFGFEPRPMNGHLGYLRNRRRTEPPVPDRTLA